MVLKACSTVMFIALALQGAIAQDPIKVEPSHYRLAFENEHVQVVNVHYGPHEKSGMHAHPGGVVVVLTEGHLRFTDEEGKAHEVFAKPGESRWYPAFKHRVENLGDTAYNAVYIVVKNPRGPEHAGMHGTPSVRDAQASRLVAEMILSAQRQRTPNPAP